MLRGRAWASLSSSHKAKTDGANSLRFHDDTCWQLNEPATQRYSVYIYVGHIMVILAPRHEILLVYELHCQHIASVPLAQQHDDVTAGIVKLR